MTESFVRKVLDWTDEKMEEIQDEDTKHPYLKAAGLGAIEGIIDGAVLAYPILLVGCIMINKHIKKLEK